MKEKLTSRKFWGMIIGIIVGVAMAFGVESDTVSNVAQAVTSAAQIIAGAATTLGSIAVYIHTEGQADVAEIEAEAELELLLDDDGETEE